MKLKTPTPHAIERSVMSDDDEVIPEWSNEGESEDAKSEASWLMMRMTSHFLNFVQPSLDEFLLKYAKEYYEESVKLDDFTIRQYELYENYIEIFESNMGTFQSEYLKTEFIETLKIATFEKSDGKDTMGSMLITMLESLSNFREFDEMVKEFWEERILSKNDSNK